MPPSRPQGCSPGPCLDAPARPGACTRSGPPRAPRAPPPRCPAPRRRRARGGSWPRPPQWSCPPRRRQPPGHPRQTLRGGGSRPHPRGHLSLRHGPSAAAPGETPWPRRPAEAAMGWALRRRRAAWHRTGRPPPPRGSPPQGRRRMRRNRPGHGDLPRGRGPGPPGSLSAAWPGSPRGSRGRAAPRASRPPSPTSRGFASLSPAAAVDGTARRTTGPRPRCRGGRRRARRPRRGCPGSPAGIAAPAARSSASPR
mmetsp:Transcript_83228/g.244036  ORF Transcript_83228/g.244036 Transcript_83228/m.244036 type:complete len:254 (-) Transcript_83228:70-831(-)